MSTQIAIQKLSKKEKIQLMEELWQDLSTNTDYSPPEWHRDILSAREKKVKEGTAKFTDWDKAKDEIKNQVS